MTVIMCCRDADPVPPFRALYGKRGGNLIFPLDLAFSSYDPETMAIPGAPILTAGIVNVGGNTIANIASYDWPIAGGKVVPIVTATPTPAIDLNQVFALPATPPDLVAFPLRVTLTNMDDEQRAGTITAFTTVSYLDLNHEIDVYEAQFDPPLFGEDRGLPVFRADNPDVLVGMVITTRPINGEINTYIARI